MLTSYPLTAASDRDPSQDWWPDIIFEIKGRVFNNLTEIPHLHSADKRIAYVLLQPTGAHRPRGSNGHGSILSFLPGYREQ